MDGDPSELFTESSPMADPSRSTLTAADVMTASPRTCSAFSSVLEALMIFRDADCGAVPVVDGDQPIGILTEGDVDSACADDPDLESRPVADLMTKEVITVGPDASLAEVGATFDRHGVNRLLVVDAGGNLLGIVARADIT